VKCKKSKIFRSSNGTGRDQDGRRKSEESVGIASSERS